MRSTKRKEFIKALIAGLNLNDNIFDYQSVAEEVEFLQEHQFLDFYKDAKRENTFGNGLKAIMNVSDKYKKPADNQNEAEAKRLINYCRAVNDSVFEDSQKYKTQFSDLIQKLKLREMVPPMDYAVLSNVKPYCNAIELISNINRYENSSTQLKEFVSALAYKDNVMSIESTKTRKMLLRTAK